MLKISYLNEKIKEIENNIKSPVLTEFQVIYLQIQLLKLKMERDIYIQRRNILLHNKGDKNE